MSNFANSHRTLLRCVSALICGAAILFNNSASAGDDAAAHTNRLAYDTAIRCFVADAYASDERRKVGDEVKADSYKAKSRESFDLAYTAGDKIGLTDKQVGRDLDFAQQTELPRLIRDQHYLLDTASTCKALGLM